MTVSLSDLSGTDSQVSPELIAAIKADPSLSSLLLEQSRRQIRKSLPDWCRLVLEPLGEEPARHHLLICKMLMQVAAGYHDRVMILAPPGSAKSTYVSKLFIAWWFANHPRSNVIAASHTIGLAESFGRWVRNTVSEFTTDLGYSLSEDSRAAAKWSTDKGGEYLAAGIGMAITGRRADLAVIDDPHKSREEADSETIRESIWTWYRSVLYTRLKPKGRIVLVMTRWHEDDLAGRLIADMESGEGDKWLIIDLKAIAEDGDILGRPIGEALWPEWESAELLRRKRGVIGEREWISQFQQKPSPAEGILFDIAKLKSTIHAPAPVLDEVRAWDLAATDQLGGRDPDYTVGLRLALLESGQFLIRRDLRRLQGTPHQVLVEILLAAEHDGQDIRIGLPQDPGQAGKSQVAFLTSKLMGYLVESSTETGSKATRAAPVATQLSAGNFLIESDHTVEKVIKDEMAAFPAGRHDDCVDALSRAFSMLVTRWSGHAVMELMRRNLEQQSLVVDGKRQDIEEDTSLIDYYHEIRNGLERGGDPNCRICGRPVGSASYVTDGVDRWHTGCM